MTRPNAFAEHVASDYDRWRADRLFLLVPAQEYVDNFSLDQVMGLLTSGSRNPARPFLSVNLSFAIFYGS